jgi:hypothetical protein
LRPGLSAQPCAGLLAPGLARTEGKDSRPSRQREGWATGPAKPIPELGPASSPRTQNATWFLAAQWELEQEREPAFAALAARVQEELMGPRAAGEQEREPAFAALAARVQGELMGPRAAGEQEREPAFAALAARVQGE